MTALIVVLSIMGYMSLGLLTARIYLSIEYAESKRLISDDYALAGIMGAFWWLSAIAFVAYLFGVHVLKPIVTPSAAKAARKAELAEAERRNQLARAGELGLPFPVTRWNQDGDW